MRVLLAIGGSTNAIIHLAAIAGRVGQQVSLKRLNALSDETPILVDLKPTGQHYMSDLFAAGGIGAVMRELKPLLHLDVLTVTGETLGERLAHESPWVDRKVVRPLADPYQKQGGLVALFGSLAPNGAIIKRSAADPRLFEREGRAVVFTSLDDLAARIDSPDLDVTPDDFLVLQNAGPKSGYAMPEAGYLPIPGKLARAGVKDMVRISDARMSGTAYGTIVLHVSPESAVGGPLAFVRNGDRIALSVANRSLNLLVDDAEIAQAQGGAQPGDRGGAARLCAALHGDGDAGRGGVRFRFSAEGVRAALDAAPIFLFDCALRGLCEKSGPRVAVALRKFVDLREHIRGKGDVHPHGFLSVGIDRNEDCHAIPVFGIGHDCLEARRLRNRLAVFDETLDMKSEGLFGHGTGIVQVLSGRDEAGKIRKRHTVVAVGVLMDEPDILEHVFTSA